MPRLNRDTRKHLDAELRRAFPTRDALERLARFELEVPLQDIVSDRGTQQTYVLELVRWAEANDRLADLVAGAHAQNASFPKPFPFPDDEEPKPRPTTYTVRILVVCVVAAGIGLAIWYGIRAAQAPPISTRVVVFSDDSIVVNRGLLIALLRSKAMLATGLAFEWLDARESSLATLCGSPTRALDVPACVADMDDYRQHVAIALTGQSLPLNASTVVSSAVTERAAVVSVEWWSGNTPPELPSMYEYLVNRLLLAALSIEVNAAGKRLTEHAPGGYEQAYYDKTTEPSSVRHLICSGHFTDADSAIIRGAVGQRRFEAIVQALSLRWLSNVDLRPALQNFRPSCVQS